MEKYVNLFYSRDVFYFTYSIIVVGRIEKYSTIKLTIIQFLLRL
jgi:hypothetical protein